jgi:alkanesulfonate monooxygenase SsuD/methylene tetrahydromethanopterin reductase-like flavin-dependent oxidoreductase (luciferase family)
MVGVLLGRDPDPIGEWLADAAAFDAAGADALCVYCGPEPDWDVLALAAALAVVTHRARLLVTPPDDPPARTVDTLERLSRGRLVLTGADRWERVPVPDGRAAWRAACADAAERGVPGLVVPADPRMLDILRNPEDPGERHDLQLAQG